MRPIIYYIRHGLTDWNAEGRFQGRRDIPLNDVGREQARRNGVALKAHFDAASILPKDLDYIASPMSRTRETMEILREELNLPTKDFKTDDRLVEASYGDFEGMTQDDLSLSHPEYHEQRENDRWNYRPAGNGESLRMAQARAVPVFDELRHDTIVVAHGAIGRAVRQYLLELDEVEAGWFIFPQDKVFKFQNNTETLI